MQNQFCLKNKGEQNDKISFKNEFGEQVSTAQDLEQISDALPAKTGVEALTPIADPATATAEDCANKINAVIAALKVVS